MIAEEYVASVQRVAPRRRLWYWQVSRGARVMSAGYEKTRAQAETRAADELAVHRAADNTWGPDYRNRRAVTS